MDAVLVTLYRVFISKTRLLEWEVADDTEKRSSIILSRIFRQIGPGLGLALIAALLVGFFAPERIIFAAPFLLIWTGSPFLIRWLSGVPVAEDSKISSEERDYLQLLAWESWRYFDELMTAEHNFLVPDNIQLVPDRVVAERTSPTNIGLSILSVISAYDLGFTSLPSAILRLGHVYDTLAKLERFHGHFLNWYQTTNLAALSPRYISFVDSGNLVGHLIAARTAFSQFYDAPLVKDEHLVHLRHRISALLESNLLPKKEQQRLAGILGSKLSPTPTNISELFQTIEVLRNFLAECEHHSDGVNNEWQRLIAEIQQIHSIQSMLCWYPMFVASKDLIINLLPEQSKDSANLHQLFDYTCHLINEGLPSLATIEVIYSNIESLIVGLQRILTTDQVSDETRSTFATLLTQVQTARSASTQLAETIEALRKQTSVIIEEVELGFLYDSAKGLFSIGYHIDSGCKDVSYYDLLASESRLGSFVAIAMGEVPQKHWFNLGRLLVQSPGGGAALVSWSATMFEYLMPLLVMKPYPGTLLSNTYRAVVKAQQNYARKLNVPWGMSESAYSGVDFEKTYQYKAFGVPALGLKRGLADDVVISPYSTALALMIEPVAALKNMRKLESQGMRGEFGFFEAIDYSTARLSSEEHSHIVRSFLSHHQAMSLISINNVLRHGIMQDRFHVDPWVRATALLLHERFPDPVPIIVSQYRELHGAGQDENEEEQRAAKGERFVTPHTRYPRTRLLSNGHYSVMVDNAGNGFSIFERETALTRWREDGIAGQYGTYIFVRDLDSGKLWSVAYQPTRVEPESYEVLFNPDKIEFIRRDFGILLHTEITISPEDNIELRRVTLTNLSARSRNLELTSYAEVALANNPADLAHPAFSKMFIESEWHQEFDGLVFSRRPRSPGEERLFLLHMLTMNTVWEPTQYESSRMEFLGRGNGISAPIILEGQEPLSETVGKILDPVFSLRTRVELEEGQSASAAFITGFARSHEEIQHLGERYHDPHSITRVFEMAWSHSNIELKHEQITISQTHAFQRLATAIIYNVDSLRGDAEALRKNVLTQSALWRFGVPGDLPMVLLRVSDPTHTKLVQELIFAHQYLRMRGLGFDLVIVNEYPGGYFQNFQEELEFLVQAGHHTESLNQKCGIYLRTSAQLSAEDLNLLEAISRVVLRGWKGDLSMQLQVDERSTEQSELKLLPSNSNRIDHYPVQVLPKADYESFNGMGGFVENGLSYQIELPDKNLPPLPWSNVIANQSFGFLVTESGAGYTWAENSRENKLTPWSNDYVSDSSGEVIYIRDANSGTLWTPTPRPIIPQHGCQVRHSFGSSRFLMNEWGVASELTISGSTTDSVKWWHLILKNHTSEHRRLEVYLYIEWVLGVIREESSRSLVTGYEDKLCFLHARNNYNNEFAGRVVSLGSNLKISSFTTNRSEFIGRHRTVHHPQHFDAEAASELSGEVGVGFDSCGVLKVDLNLAPGQEQEVLFYLSESPSIEEARERAPQHQLLSTRLNELSEVNSDWTNNLSAIQVRTPDRAFDISMNGWLLYQTLSCRVYGRSAFYQSGGAIGFRDQLQDVLALLYSRSDLARAQILVHAARQFVEGDVQHWWHPPTGRGVRTRISDDYLWLPYVVARYLEFTGERDLLDEQVPFIQGVRLEEHQMESYFFPQVSEQTGSIYEHCTLALERAWGLRGEHGLPLMRGGDWNDGMNEVGKEEKGESVWLAWFLSDCLRKFAVVAKSHGNNSQAVMFDERAQELVQSIEKHGWDGEWYRRAYFDDGTPLGSALNDECKIDSISQSWSVITGGGDSKRKNTAMDSASRELVRKEENLICLLSPPFDKSAMEPGYIKGYLPGTRENGGQYTHAAAWMIMATAMQGKGNDAFNLFSTINPINITKDETGLQRYKGEPYVLSGDVYSITPHEGRAGWSWYTGSAAWLYQVGIEHILGLKVRGDYFTVNPVVPESWDTFSITYHRENVCYEIEIINPQGVQHGVSSITVDGQIAEENRIYFVSNDDLPQRSIRVGVTMGLDLSVLEEPSDKTNLGFFHTDKE